MKIMPPPNMIMSEKPILPHLETRIVRHVRRGLGRLIAITLLCMLASVACSGLRSSTVSGGAPPPGPLSGKVSFNGKLLLVGEHLWDIESGKELRQFPVPRSITMPNGGAQGKTYLTGAVLGPNGNRILTAVEALIPPELVDGGLVQLWDVATGQEIGHFQPQEGLVMDVDFSPDGNRILVKLHTASNYDTIQVWDAELSRRLLVLQGLRTSINGPSWRYMSYSPDRDKIMVLTFRKVTIYDAVSAKELCVVEQEDKASLSFNFAQFSPDGSLILTTDGDRRTCVWDAKTGRLIRSFSLTRHKGHGGEQPYALFVPHSRNIASGTDDGAAVLWSLDSGKEIRRFDATGLSPGSVDQMTLSSDGKRLITIREIAASAPVERIACLWDVESGRLLRQFDAEDTMVGFSPADERVLTIRGGKPFSLWDSATGKIIRQYNAGQ